jgi:D-sedoheptulose 7-phosphate isomerase
MTAGKHDTPQDWQARITAEIASVARNFERLAGQASAISAAADLMMATLRHGGKILLCGNGGSAADAQHLAAELMGRYLKDRPPLAALALTVDTSALTAIANDYAFEEVFARQLRGIGREGDLLVAISTSGTSANVVRAVETAVAMKIATIALTGEAGGQLADLVDVAIRVPATRTNAIQEMHIAVGHILCGIVEDTLC